MTEAEPCSDEILGQWWLVAQTMIYRKVWKAGTRLAVCSPTIEKLVGGLSKVWPVFFFHLWDGPVRNTLKIRWDKLKICCPANRKDSNIRFLCLFVCLFSLLLVKNRPWQLEQWHVTLVPGTWEAEVGAKAAQETPSQDCKEWFGSVCYKEKKSISMRVP